jgi:hypothetical protein
MINHICAKIGIHPSQLVLTWASPDCRTYARANTANISRGNEFRNHKTAFHAPKDTIDDKRMMAIQHDLLIHSLLESFIVTLQADPGALVVMENPSASLRRRSFVKIFETLLGLTCHLVHYCAFDALVRKPSDIWTNMEWSPTGTTGNGQCGRKCNSGFFTSMSGTRAYRHPEHIAGTATRAPKGAFAKARVPAMLHEEILDTALEHWKAHPEASKRKYVLELFAGSTRLGTVARQKGLSYIAVDMCASSAKCFQQLHGTED